MRRWRAVIVETQWPITDGQARDLTEVLQFLAGQEWEVRFVLPNGVNRWTVIASKDETIVLQEG